jgi:hypothetical protein
MPKTCDVNLKGLQLITYGMLNIPAEHDRDTSSAKLKDISRQLSFSPIYVSAATRELWWMSQE